MDPPIVMTLVSRIMSKFGVALVLFYPELVQDWDRGHKMQNVLETHNQIQHLDDMVEVLRPKALQHPRCSALSRGSKKMHRNRIARRKGLSTDSYASRSSCVSRASFSAPIASKIWQSQIAGIQHCSDSTAIRKGRTHKVTKSFALTTLLPQTLTWFGHVLVFDWAELCASSRWISSGIRCGFYPSIINYWSIACLKNDLWARNQIYLQNRSETGYMNIVRHPLYDTPGYFQYPRTT